LLNVELMKISVVLSCYQKKGAIKEVVAVVCAAKVRTVLTIFLRWSGAAAFSNWPDYLRHVGLSVGRLLMHVALFSSLTVSVALAACWPQPTSSLHFDPATCERADRERTPNVEFA
jgi:hypothetical protein